MERYSAVGNVIEKIVQDHGINALLDTRFAIAVFTDLAPTMRKEKELLLFCLSPPSKLLSWAFLDLAQFLASLLISLL